MRPASLDPSPSPWRAGSGLLLLLLLCCSGRSTTSLWGTGLPGLLRSPGAHFLQRSARCQTLHTLAQLEAEGWPPACSTPWRAHPSTSLDNQTSHQLASTLWSLGKRGLRNKPKVKVVVEATVQRLLLTGLTGLGPRDLAQTWWALATLRFRNQQALQQLLQYTVEEGGLERFDPRCLSNALWALATLRMADAPTLHRVCTCLVRQGFPARFLPQEVSNVLWALAMLQYNDEALVGDAVRFMAQADVLNRSPAQALANVVWASAMRRGQEISLTGVASIAKHLSQPLVVQSLPPRGLANVAWALDRLGFRSELASIVGHVASQRHLLVFRPREMAMLLAALDHLRIPSETLEWKLHQRHISYVLAVMSALSMRGGLAGPALAPVLDRLRAPNVVEKLEALDCCHLLTALAATDNPDGAFMRRITQRLLRPGLLRGLDIKQVTSIFLSLAHLRQRRPQLLEALAQRIVDTPHRRSPHSRQCISPWRSRGSVSLTRRCSTM
eukprot:GGOE01019744.1.p1 GENE.GGOE01019744.1~~GGOE01019744.1.p1  ORF type:complete len:499 (+),score=89.10 GGOE01019744.1:93-1589(+)